MYKYEKVIFWSNEDRCWIVEIPELSGCHAHGETPNEAIIQSDEAIECWIEMAEELGINIPEPLGRVAFA